MTVERRLATLLLVLGLIAVPAAALRAFCVGNSCDAEEDRSEPVPFCSLDPSVRDLVSAGFYEGRSPDVLGVTGATDVTTSFAGTVVPWPSTRPTDDRVPLVFLGEGIVPGQLPEGVELDQVAPTLEPVLGIERPFPEVRSGERIDGVTRGEASPLVVVIVWRGVGMPELEMDPTAWSFLGAALGDGAGGQAFPGSHPLDPAAVVATIGTGGPPAEHGITGSVLRGDHGPVTAFAPGAPGTVIAALGDDLDEATDGRSEIALVATTRADRGLIGDSWYGGQDDEVVVIERRDPAGAVASLIAEGWGADDVPDLIGVTMAGSVDRMDARTRAIVRTVSPVTPATFVLTATGSLAATADTTSAVEVARRVEARLGATDPVVAAPGAGGFFLDDEAALDQGITSQQVADAMDILIGPGGEELFDDTFPSFTVRFGRYC